MLYPPYWRQVPSGAVKPTIISFAHELSTGVSMKSRTTSKPVTKPAASRVWLAVSPAARLTVNVAVYSQSQVLPAGA